MRTLSLWTFALIVLFAFYQNCQPLHEGLRNFANEAGLPAGYTLQADPALQSSALNILSTKCASCHQDVINGGVSQILNVNHLVGMGLISPGDATKGRLIGAISEGSMPPSGTKVTSQELQILKDWISSMTLVGTIPLPTPTPSPLPAGKTVSADGLLKARALTVLNINCAGCHEGIVSGGITAILNTDHLVASGLIVVGQPDSSRLIAAITDDTMPKGSGARVTAADLQTLKDWIRTMSLVDADPSNPETPWRPALSGTYSSLDANVFQPKCYACHGPVLAEEGKRFDTYARVFSNSDNMYSECSGGKMPESPYPLLTPEELAAFRQWIQSGRPNN